MPVRPTYPGVYFQEKSEVRTIVGVATSVTAFVGRTQRGELNKPTKIQSPGEFERVFGGLSADSTLSYAVSHYFLNGGSDAVVVRVASNAKKAKVTLPATVGSLVLEAASEGLWGNKLLARADYLTRNKNDDKLFNLFVKDDGTGRIEEFRNVSIDPSSARYIGPILEGQSDIVRISATSSSPLVRPIANSPSPTLDMFPSSPVVPPPPPPAPAPLPIYYTVPAPPDPSAGSDGDPITDAEIKGDEDAKTGIHALGSEDFNLLCLPPLTWDKSPASDTWRTALGFCRSRLALLLVDPPVAGAHEWRTAADAADPANGVPSWSIAGDDAAFGAIYFPLITMADPLAEDALETFVPCGAVAGVFARTDAQRGVWKAPAGQDASLSGVQKLSVNLTDGENGQLNPMGINCLRSFPFVGNVVWGARTLQGADDQTSQWKYVPVRRVANFIEGSLYRGTKWVVFEPNDEPLWAQIRLNVGAFMNTLFRQGAFQGRTPSEAYFVKCDKETTTQDDINRGIVNIIVGFAPLKPAEFVVITITQMAGQIQT